MYELQNMIQRCCFICGLKDDLTSEFATLDNVCFDIFWYITPPSKVAHNYHNSFILTHQIKIIITRPHGLAGVDLIQLILTYAH